MKSPLSSGFTLLEVVVVLGVVALLAAVLTPIVSGHLEDARLQRARADARTIASALQAAHEDLGDFPIFRDGARSARNLTDTDTYDVLAGRGALPRLDGAGWSAADDGGNDRGALGDQLVANAPGYPVRGRFSWQGPYMETPYADPWGHAFLVNAENLRPAQGQAAYVLSAGPDGVVQTDFELDRLTDDVVGAGDDVLVRLR